MKGFGVTINKFAAVLIIAALASLVLASACPLALAASGWSKTYGGTGHDIGTGETVQTSDGGYAVSGDTNSSGAGGTDFWLFKTNADGNMQWNKTYGGPLNERTGDMVLANDGGYAICGGTYSFGAVGEDFWLVKTDAAGNLQWSKTYGGAGLDYAMHIVQSSDGGYAFLGQTNSLGAGGNDFWLVKTDANGNMQWNKTYGGNGTDNGNGLVQTSDGGYALMGRTNSFGAGGDDAWLVKTDANGNTQWNKTYGWSGADQGYVVVQTTDGGFAFNGYTTSFGNYSVSLAKTDANGNLQWNKTYSTGTTAGFYINIGIHMIQTSDGGYAIDGWNYANGQDFILIKTDANGNMQWWKNYGGPGIENAYAILQSSDGGYLLTGNTASFSVGVGSDVWLVKTDANGVLPIDPNALAATAFTSVSVLRGWTWYFFVHHNGGEAPYTYQWYEGTALMSGQSSQWLPVSKMSTGTFTFYCKVTDAQGRAVTSNGVTLRVIG